MLALLFSLRIQRSGQTLWRLEGPGADPVKGNLGRQSVRHARLDEWDCADRPEFAQATGYSRCIALFRAAGHAHRGKHVAGGPGGYAGGRFHRCRLHQKAFTILCHPGHANVKPIKPIAGAAYGCARHVLP